MKKRIAERLIWAVDELDVQPDDRVLEVGCGYGHAIPLVCQHLNSGHMTALDRSAEMIERARQGNQEFLAAGKLSLHHAALTQAELELGSFNKIFAVNVNVFWLKPQAELLVVRRLLAAGGGLYLFYQPPSAIKAEQIRAALEQRLQANGFRISRSEVQTLSFGTGVVALAR
jgi:SAM-dependent methyltransferase